MASDDYLAKLAWVLQSLRLGAGSVTHVFVAHDDWCRFWSGARCNCQPELRVYRDASRPGAARLD